MTDKQFKYLVKLIVISAVMTISCAFLGSTIANERLLYRMDKSYKRLMEWSKKADLANEMLNDMFKVQQTKENYERQGIKATEDYVNPEQKEGNNENNNKKLSL